MHTLHEIRRVSRGLATCHPAAPREMKFGTHRIVALVWKLPIDLKIDGRCTFAHALDGNPTAGGGNVAEDEIP
jgi:hypothetical protein